MADCLCSGGKQEGKARVVAVNKICGYRFIVSLSVLQVMTEGKALIIAVNKTDLNPKP